METSVTAAWVYFGVGCFAVSLAIISLLFAEIGDFFHDISSPIGDWLGDHFSLGHDHEVGFSHFINNGGILGFVGGFGFIAAFAMSTYSQSTAAAAGWGVLGGFLLGGILGAVWFALQKSGGTSAYSEQELVGEEAVVVEKIFAQGLGKIECVAGKTKAWHVAKSKDGQEIPEGTPAN